ncbi:MAG: 2-amino-4-hydroxy-6-hydroxymethyldihydropteridine diphosphokinase [Hyphomicrobiales bacterium]|nr:2-amino-4-hydroxy-6-hydroxymethyldihydropteridine diphosphokinase [Hyphomicrobiales bacterium]MBV8663390.1 2-amino-4-hydroxy-6-hydroxymethyldihydropteridine diphosphokinase [Hyphomicrobiales bacterium]
MASDRRVSATLGLGGNLGDVVGAFAYALAHLKAAPGVGGVRGSSVYRTPPWGKVDQPDFLNMAALVETTLPARKLLDLCLEIERGMGRLRLERWGPRTLDVDILTYGDAAIDEPDLKVPHPRMFERAFVLAPLAEIAPGLAVGGRTIAQALEAVDRAGIERDAEATARLEAGVATL